MREAVIVAIARTAVGKAPRGTLRQTRADELAAAVFRELLRRTPALDKREIEDVILGCAMPEAEQGMNMARIAAVRTGLPIETSAMTINRFLFLRASGDCARSRTHHGRPSLMSCWPGERRA